MFVHLLGAVRAVLRVLGEQPQHERFQRLGDVGPDAADRQRWFVQMPVQHAEGGGPGERHIAAEQFVQQDAEGVEVGVRADRAAHGLLGGHVGRGADGRAGVREAGGVGVEDGGDAEVEDEHGAVRTDHHVTGLEVAVDDRHGVHGAEDGAQLRGHRDGPGPGVRVVFGEVVAEVGALHVLHDEEQVVAVAAGVVHGDQARVVHLCGDPALADEAAAQLVGGRAADGSGDPVGAQQLDRDPAVEALVVGRPDLAHAALAEDRRQLVPPADEATVHRPSSLRR